LFVLFFYFGDFGVILEIIALFEDNIFAFLFLFPFLFYTINTALLG